MQLIKLINNLVPGVFLLPFLGVGEREGKKRDLGDSF